MGKKSSSSQPSQADPMSPTFEAPRMDPPPPYDTVARSSTSSSVRSVDRLNPGATGPSQMQPHQTQNADAMIGGRVAAGNSGSGGPGNESKNPKYRQDGGCCKRYTVCQVMEENTDNAGRVGNYGHNSGGCMVCHFCPCRDHQAWRVGC